MPRSSARVCGVSVGLRVVPHIWAIIRVAVQEDDGTVEIGDAVEALQDLAAVFRRKKKALRDIFSHNANHVRMLRKLEAEAKDIRKHVDEDGELDGEESTDVSGSAGWLSSWTGPGTLLCKTKSDATVVHNLMTQHLTADSYDEDDPESSYVLCDGPVRQALDKARAFIASQARRHRG